MLLCGLLLPSPGRGMGETTEDFNLEEQPAAPARKEAWLFSPRPAMPTAALQLAHANGLRDLARTRAALRAYEALFLRWPAASEASVALQAFARLQEDRGDSRRAFDEYQYLIDRYPGQFDYGRIIARQYAIAERIRDARKGRFLFGKGFAAPERAVPLFEQVAQNAPNWDKAPQALYQAGAIRRQIGEYEEAIATFTDLQARYPNDPLAEAALLATAECMGILSTRMPHDKALARQARSYAAAFLADYPDSPGRKTAQALLSQVDERLARHMFDEASFYDRSGKTNAAATAYRELARSFPSGQWSARAQQRLAEIAPREEKPE